MPVVGGAYSDDARDWSAQDCVNFIPGVSEREGASSPSKLTSAPGLRQVVQGSGAVRGARDVEGKLFVVIGTQLVWVKSDYSVQYLGTISGAGRVSMTHNQITGGNEVVIGNGTSGYVYSTVTGALTQITDDAFPGFLICDYVDSYILGIEPLRRFWFHSDLASATSYISTDRYEAEASPDRMRSLIVDHREVIVFGERTTEVFINTGASAATFERATGTVIEVGCLATHSVAKMDSSTFWLGHDGIVYRLDGYTPQRISTLPIEQALSRSSKASLYNAFAVTYEDRGHKIYYLTVNDGHTWGYDISTGEWHRRQSFGLDRWRINTLTRWNNKWIAGDYTNGQLYEVDWDYMLEGCDPLVRERITGPMQNGQNPFRVYAAEVVTSPGDYVSTCADIIGISGDAPDGQQGDAYSYTYTTIGGTGPYVYTVNSGALPSGVTLPVSSVATISGTLNNVELSTFSIKVTDSVGLTAVVHDTINTPTYLPEGKFWLIRDEASPASALDKIWYSANTTSWGSSYTLSTPTHITSDTLWMADRMFFGDVGGTKKIISDIDPSNGIASTDGATIVFTRAQYVAGLLILCRHNGGTTYAISSDKGATFTEYTCPDSGGVTRMSSVAKLGNIWMCNLHNSYIHWSAQATPTAWQAATVGGAGGMTTGDPILASDTAAVVCKGSAGVLRTTDGKTWAISETRTMASAHTAGICVDGVFLFGSDANTCSVERSTDDGLTFTNITVTGGTGTPQRFTYGDGIVVMMQGNKMFKSLNLGATWSEITPPAGNTGGMGYYVGYAGDP